MGTGMPLGGRNEAPPPTPTPRPWVGKGLEGEGAPTFGGLAGTAGLGLTSGGTMSDISAEGQESKNKTKNVGTSIASRTVEPSQAAKKGGV